MGWFSQGQGVDEQSYYSLIGGDVNAPSINNVLAFGATEGYDAEGLYLNDFDFVAPNPNYPQSILDEWFFNEATIPDGTVLRFGAPGMVVGLNDVETQFINVYPNPVEDFLYLDLPDNAQASQIDVFSLDGKVQKTFSGQSVQELLYLADLEKGLYILKVEAEGQEFTAKVLKD